MNGNVRFIEDLKWRGTIFPLGRFNDYTSPEGTFNYLFIVLHSFLEMNK
jgi:hypothetical protein